ncbi:MAG: hypothetical protein QM680_09740 [Luteolibacter sp.]
MVSELISLLHTRLDLIADHAWRDRAPAAHLQALAEVSGKITGWAREHRVSLDPTLRHYLANASYQKALNHAENLHAGEENP